MRPEGRNRGGPSPDFVSLVKDALEHLYDPARLGDHPLVGLLLPERLPSGASQAQALRQALLDGIDRLDPGPAVPAGSRAHRAQQVLALRYVEALSYREAMAELGLSQTQFHRDQRHALDCLAALLWETASARWHEETPDGAGVDRATGRRGDGETGVDAETGRRGDGASGSGVAASPRRPDAPSPRQPRLPCAEVEAAAHNAASIVDLNTVTRGVIEMLRPVAQGSGVGLRDALSPDATPVRGSRTAIRQSLISLASYTLEAIRGGELTLASEQDERQVTLRLTSVGALAREALQTPEASERLEVVRQLLQPLGGNLEIHETRDGLAASVVFPAEARRLLVVDDNPDMVHLIARFVADESYTVLSAGSVSEGLALARNVRPDAILLDIMIPEQDGWDALQALKQDPATQNTPVLVCTVLNEAPLALAMGAAEFIRKPVTRPRLLAALSRWCAPRPTGRPHPSPLPLGEGEGCPGSPAPTGGAG